MRARRLVSLVPVLMFWVGCSAGGPEPGAEQHEGLFRPGHAQSTRLAGELSLQHLAERAALAGIGELEVARVEIEEGGEAHCRVRQSVDGIPVFAGEAIVHLDPDGALDSVTDSLVQKIEVDTTPALAEAEAVEVAAAAAGGWQSVTGEPRADLQILRHEGVDHLTYRVQLEAVTAEGEPSLPVAFVDARSGELVWSYDNLKHALNRKIYSAQNGTALPGVLVRSEGQFPVADTQANQAYTNIGTTYSYYLTRHNLDGFGLAGGNVSAVVHYGQNYVNALNLGGYLVFGDGDGINSGPLTVLDVTSHELTHWITDATSALTYANEPGAISESLSDIFAAATEAFSDGAVSADTWKIAEDCWTPNSLGDALRYMSDPFLGGDSDYYPTRYTGASDNGGVHLNSGIANLAFYLMVMGGSHPRGKTTTVVPALDAVATTSITKAAAIFYRANNIYFTSSTSFAGARAGTIQAATDLYGSAAATSVGAAWTAVGVGAPITWLTLSTQSNLSGAIGSSASSSHAAPAGATRMRFRIYGGSGDADLYVKRGSAPTTSSYDCRPYLAGNSETCTFDPSQAGTYYVMIRGHAAYSGVTLKVEYTQ